MMLRHQFHLRDATVAGRSLTLACVPFDRATWIRDQDGEYRELFHRGAFAHIDPARVQLRYQHSDDLLDRLGQGTSLREDGDYLVGDFAVVRGSRGDHVLDLVGDGQIRGVSIGFVAGESITTDTPDGRVVERVRVKSLPEVSLVDEPAYAEAQVLAMQRKRADDAEQARRRAILARVADARRARDRQWSLYGQP